MLLSTEIAISKVKDASGAGQTGVNSDAVDMQGYEGVLFLVNAGAITSGGVQSINVAQSDDSGGSPDDYSDLLGSKVTIADDDDNQLFFVEVKNPQKRYVRLEIARATQDSAFGPIYAFLYGAKIRPVNNNVANTITGEVHIGPAEGTA